MEFFTEKNSFLKNCKLNKQQLFKNIWLNPTDNFDLFTVN
jgi:hypothetical protein